MTTYYEILSVKPDASQGEIEQALDTEYNKWRRLVTHHDPEVVNQANQALQVLEKIRSVLTDPGKRSAYDAASGTVVSGLEDPTARIQGNNPLPAAPLGGSKLSRGSPHVLPPTQSTAQNAWICPKCHVSNVVNSQFCKGCGEILAITCPICNKQVERGAQFCTSCGVSIPQAQQKKELEAQLGQARSELSAVERTNPVPGADLKDLKKQVFYAGVWAVVSLSAGIAYLFALPGYYPGVDLSSLFLKGTSFYYNYSMQTSDIWLTVLLLGLLIAVILFLSIAKKVSPLRGLGAILSLLLFLGLPRTLQSLFLSSGMDGYEAGMANLPLTAFLYMIMLVILLGLPRRNYRKLKPFNPKLPKLGFLGTLYGLALLAVPFLYGAYFFFYITELTEYSMTLARYEHAIWLINAIQLFGLGLTLCGYVVLGWTTSQGIESRYRQAIFEREAAVENLNKKLKSLENAISNIILHPK